MFPTKLWNIRFVNLLIIDAVFQFATYMLNPVISSYVVLLGSSLAIGGFVSGLVALSALAVRPFTGWIADSINKATLLIISAFLFTFAALGCAVVTDVTWISVFRIVQGVAFAFRSAVVVCLISAAVPQNYLGIAVGWDGVLTMVSCSIAPAVASLISSQYGFNACFMISGLLFALGLLLSVLFKFYGQSERKQVTGIGKPGNGRTNLPFGIRSFMYLPALPYSAIAALSGVPHGINVSLILIVGDCRGIAGISLYFTLYAIAALISRPFVGRICDTKGFEKVIIPVLLIDLVGVVFLIVMNSLAFVVVAGALVGFGQGSAYSALQAESVRNVKSEEIGRASNTYYIGPDLNMGLTPFLAGFIMQFWGVTMMYLIALVLVASALFIVLYIKKKQLILSRHQPSPL